MAGFVPDPQATGVFTPDKPQGTGAFTPDAPAAPAPKEKDPAAHYKALARSYASQYGIKPDVFERLIFKESSWNPRATSPVGAQGLGQLMPDTAKQYGVTDPYDPAQSLQGAARKLAADLKLYGGDYTKTFAAYNGGPGALAHFKEHHTYKGYGVPANPKTGYKGDPNETYNYLHDILGYTEDPPKPTAPPAKKAATKSAGFQPNTTFTGSVGHTLGELGGAINDHLIKPAGSALSIALDYLNPLSLDSPIAGAVMRDEQKAGPRKPVTPQEKAALVKRLQDAKTPEARVAAAQDLMGRLGYGFNPRTDVGPNVTAVAKLLGHPTPENMHKAAELYSVSSHANGDPTAGFRGGVENFGRTLQAASAIEPTGAAGQAIGGALASDPLVSGAEAMALQSVSAAPLAGAGARLAGKGAKAALDASAVGQGLTHAAGLATDALSKTKQGAKLINGAEALKNNVDRFRPFRKAAEKVGVDPHVAEQVGRSYVAANDNARANAATVAQHIYADLRPDQMAEVERRHEALGDPTVQPNLALDEPTTGLSLNDRALQLHGVLVQSTDQKRALDLLEESRVFDPERFTPRGGPQGDVYDFPTQNPLIQEFLARRTQGAGVKDARLGTSAAHKVFQNYDEAKASGMLSPNYNPATNLVRYLTSSGTKVAQENAYRDLQHLGILPEQVFVDSKGNVLGRGKAGMEQVNKVAEQAGIDDAQTKALQAMNDLRAQRGEPSMTMTEYVDAQRAVGKKSKTFYAMQAASKATKQAQRAASKAASGAQRTQDLVGAELLRNVNQRSQQLDRMNASIDKIRTRLDDGDTVARGRTLISMVERRDALAQELDAMHDRVRAQGERTFGNGPTAETKYYNALEQHGPDSQQARDAFLKANKAQGESQIYGPVVGKLQELHGSIAALPDSPEKSAILRRLTGLGKRAALAPTKAADAIDPVRMQRWFAVTASQIARQSVNPYAQGVAGKLDRMAASLEGAIAKDQGRLYIRRDALSRPATRTAQILLDAQSKAAKVQTDLLNKYQFAKAVQPDVEAFQRAFRNALPSAKRNVKTGILNNSDRLAYDRLGQVPGARYPIGSPTRDFATADPQVMDFFLSQGAQQPEAEGIGAFLDGMNKLARIGVITNPVQHAGWNLGMHFLAAGGHPGFFLRDMWRDPEEIGASYSKAFGKQMSGADWVAAADAQNAILHTAATHGLFGGDFGLTLAGPKVMSKEGFAARGLVGSMDAAATRAWNMNQRVVMGTLEKRYAVALFRHKVENEGMSAAEAGIAVRKALGDYANVSKGGIEGALNKTMFFYPWLKTIVPFWMDTVTRKPQFITVPYMGIRRWDQAIGDPNMDSESPGTIDLGADVNGQRAKMTFPGPQKIVQQLLEIAAPHGDYMAGLPERGQAARRIAASHLRPYTSGMVYAALDTAFSPAKPPGGSNFNTILDRDAPPMTQIGQTAQFVGQRLPGVENIEGAGRGIGAALSGNPRGLLAPFGGYQYERNASNHDPVAKAHGKLTSKINRINRNKNLSPTQKADKRAKAYKVYDAVRARHDKPTTHTGGFHPDTTAGFTPDQAPASGFTPDSP